jgi:hypothetical protein
MLWLAGVQNNRLSVEHTVALYNPKTTKKRGVQDEEHKNGFEVI